MSDDVTKALRLALAEVAGSTRRVCVSVNTAESLLAYIDSEPQRIAAAVTDERRKVVGLLEELHAEGLTLPLPQDYVDGIECALEHLRGGHE